MLKLLAGNVIAAHANVARMSDQFVAMEREAHEKGGVGLTLHAVQTLKDSVEHLQQAAADMNMVASKAAADRLLEVVDGLPKVPGGYSVYWNELMGLRTGTGHLTLSFTDELHGRLVFTLASEDAALITNDAPPFGAAVADAFPLASEDIAEAAQCLGFGRFTASVFHLMRAMEATVQILANRLGVQKVEKEWGKLLSDIEQKIKEMPKGDERDKWSRSHTHLYHVKQAWRNNTMHPKKTYTQDEAGAVFSAVKSFLIDLSTLI